MVQIIIIIEVLRMCGMRRSILAQIAATLNRDIMRLFIRAIYTALLFLNSQECGNCGIYDTQTSHLQTVEEFMIYDAQTCN